VSFYLPELEILISGDTLFNCSVGRTDFPYGNFDDLKRSIRLLYELPDNTLVIPGHGEFTNIGYEKKHNPFVKF
ncbi:MAG: MBL fold metallo-hydrolase, partial [Calditerrivibrio sp.]|nr:MBL fold metallo-hydrolase [Calditerrivibrio sp.]MCA1932641.1 MBL fold metallo-hydrolase [Calditerrivibrio sp.]MCA1980423.1 MBL fold metallo-hydrolase [Calditerrivibrio sp.]